MSDNNTFLHMVTWYQVFLNNTYNLIALYELMYLFLFSIGQSAGAVEYYDLFSASG